ncbi:Crp/Fnr family transcriptional regulator [Sphingobacterium sp. HJSM2_6]|uniref:Crp/Fnr family transcriptional regulator n=1 Tax=Sphingobacterium sp. HJSM2_6 TaxID=3366264 RepID=UPI003BE822F9
MEIKDHLFHLFETSTQNISTIQAKFERRDIQRADLILESGKLCQELSFIASGFCRVYKSTEDKEVTQWIGSPGYFLTDLSSFLFDQKANWNIEALTPMTLWTLKKSDYHLFEQEIPDWNIFEKRFVAKCFIQMENRIFDFIALTAEERYQQYFEHHKTLFQHVPLQYIASVLGMSPETLSRIRKKI